LDGETIGTVYIRHDLSETRAMQRHYVIIAALVMCVALFDQLADFSAPLSNHFRAHFAVIRGDGHRHCG